MFWIPVWKGAWGQQMLGRPSSPETMERIMEQVVEQVMQSYDMRLTSSIQVGLDLLHGLRRRRTGRLGGRIYERMRSQRAGWEPVRRDSRCPLRPWRR